MQERNEPGQTQGVLYVVATPIGNLEDMTPRGVRVLSEVDLIAAEDTRHSARLLQHFGIDKRMVSLHEHNEPERVKELTQWLADGHSLALISDAGTPLISDPGFRLVREARRVGVRVVAVPGVCAATTALSVAGLPTDRFVFEGFPPARTHGRRALFEQLRAEPRTLVFYESPHRILESLADMEAVFGSEREVVLARELTKKFETVHTDTLAGLRTWLDDDENRRKGEFVVMVHGAPPAEEREVDPEAERVLRILVAELPLKQAAQLGARITGGKKNALYQRALALAGEGKAR